MIHLRNAVVVAAAIGTTIGILILMATIIGYILPLSASEALNRTPKGAHELGFWLLLLISLPFWLIASWLSALATIRNRQGRRGARLAIWAFALLLSMLAVAATRNALGFGDLFSPI